MRRLNTRGFTIIELLIATVAFSLLLLIITGAIIQFSKIYYRGVVTAKTQEVARTIAEDMARSAQFSETGVQTGSGCYIFGSQRYKFTELSLKNSSNHVIQIDSATSCTAPISVDSTELMGDGMQLRRLRVDPSATGAKITVTVAYGSDVLADNRCPTINLGGQFCAVSTIETTVTKRIGD